MSHPHTSGRLAGLTRNNEKRGYRAHGRDSTRRERRAGARLAHQRRLVGLRHGAYCIGCCAALMLLLFAVAVMDLRWVVALTVLVTAEKLLPRPQLWRHAMAAVLILVGLALGAQLVL